MSNHNSTVLTYFTDVYQIEAIPKASGHKLHRYRQAIVQLHVFLQTEVILRDVSPDTLDHFEHWLANEGYGGDSRRNYRLCVQRIMNHADPEVFPPSTPVAEDAIPIVKATDNPFVRVDLKPDPTMTLLRFVTDVYVPLKCTSRRTAAMYSNSVRSLQQHYGRQIAVGELCNDLVLPWLAKKHEDMSPSTVKRHRGDVVALWNFAYRKDFCPVEPKDVPRVKIPYRIPEAWSLEEFGRLVIAANHLKGWVGKTEIRSAAWWASLLLFMYDTSTRIGATLAVRTEDVDLERRRVVLQSKNAKTELCQVVGFSRQTADALAEHFNTSRDLVWPYPNHTRKIWEQFKLILTAAGLPSGRTCCFHKIRKTSATQITSCISLEAARQQLGHTTPEMTKSAYVDPRQMGTNVADMMPRPRLEGGAA